MLNRSIKNAVIKKADIQFDRGCLSFWLHLDYGGAGQGFGGWTMDEPPVDRAAGLERRGTAFGTECVLRILRTVGVNAWSELAGKSIRADSENGRVHSIGHFLEDKWFNPTDLASQMLPSREPDA